MLRIAHNSVTWTYSRIIQEKKTDRFKCNTTFFAQNLKRVVVTVRIRTGWAPTAVYFPSSEF